VDWDRLRVFHAAADAGSFTHAGEALGLSQSAVSRQVGALELDLRTPLFHRHARGLILTEQGELLYQTVQDVFARLESTRARLTDTRERPHGELRVTTNHALGTGWLTPRLTQFLELYPEVKVRLILTDDELDLGMREADVALRLREPQRPDLIRRRLFTVHYHLYGSQDYVARAGHPKTLDELENHRLLSFAVTGASFLDELNALLHVAREPKDPRKSALAINNMMALSRAVTSGVGLAVLPDYMDDPQGSLVQLLVDDVTAQFECYLVYPEEMKNVARVQVFRDFLVTSAQRWRY
jgi:DNA-binding transcriptional LysR family regulator